MINYTYICTILIAYSARTPPNLVELISDHVWSWCFWVAGHMLSNAADQVNVQHCEGKGFGDQIMIGFWFQVIKLLTETREIWRSISYDWLLRFVVGHCGMAFFPFLFFFSFFLSEKISFLSVELSIWITELKLTKQSLWNIVLSLQYFLCRVSPLDWPLCHFILCWHLSPTEWDWSISKVL